MEKIKIILVDDHKIFLEGLSNMLSKEKDIEIVKTFHKPKEALQFIKENPIDLLISDFSMPEMNGGELVEKVKKTHPDIKTLFITMFHELKNTEIVDGYMLKDSEFEEVKRAIHAICIEDKKYISSSIPEYDIYEEEIFTLSSREKDIINLISKEFTTEEIANKLFLSKHTIEAHRKNIFSKLQVKNIAGLVKKAFYLGILK